MSSIRILGLDPSMSNWGMALAEYDLQTEKLSVGALQLISTASGKKDAKVVRKSSDDLRRATEIYQGLRAFIGEHKPAFTVAEVPSGAQSARASFSNGLCVGILASIPVIQVNPLEVKMATVGHKYASKEEMIEWAMATYPAAPWRTRRFKSEIVPLADNEHLADACAVISAGIQTDVFKGAVKLMRLINH